MSADKPTQIQLEGWLPGEQQCGLPAVADDLKSAYDKAWDLDEDTTAATLTLVIGYLEVTKTSKRKNRHDRPPIVATRFIALEVIPNGDDHDTADAILRDIRDNRTGATSLPGIDGKDDESAGDLGGQPTT